jgi:predicted GNAT family N-acyltransferase
MFKIVSFRIHDKERSDIAFSIRQKVFVDEQKVSREEEYDSHEDESTHFLIYKEETPIGTARWRFTDKGVKLERFAILADYRKLGAGNALVNFVLADVAGKSNYIYLNSQVSAMNLYAKCGFEAEGDLFYEANIPHFKMVLKG